jgi:hypothetical protein
MPDNPAGPTTPISTAQLQTLQDGISASVQILLKAYDQTADPVVSATLLGQQQQLAAQMGQIETAIFHQETVLATATMAAAFTAANGFTAELTGQAQSLDQVSKIITSAAKLIGVVAQIIPYL